MTNEFAKIAKHQMNQLERVLAVKDALLSKLKNAVNDHAPGEFKRVGCIETAIRVLIDDPDFKLNQGECAHHKLGLIASAIEKACHKVMTDRLGEELDSSIGEFKSNNIVTMFQRQLALLFGHHVGSYVFGDGVILFPRWFKHKYPNLQLSRMDRQVGSRHGVMLKNAMVHYYMFDVYR